MINRLFRWLSVCIMILLIANTTAFIIIPSIETFVLSFSSGRGKLTDFVGISNYVKLFSDHQFIQAFINTTLFAIIQTVLMLSVSMIVALAICKLCKKYQVISTTILFVPFVISPVVYTVFFRSIFSYDGLVNALFSQVNPDFIKKNWFMGSFDSKIIIILMCTWAWSGFYTILYVNAIQRININLLDSVRVDGINGWKQFLFIIFPQIKFTVFFTICSSLCGSIQIFTESYLLNNGGPNYATLSLVQYIYKLSFVFIPNFGYAATISCVVIIFGISTLVFLRKWGYANERE